jgi:predicted RecA/RadA family phage recombinase
MKVSFEGIGEQVLSFNKASGVSKGSLVKLSTNATVAACAAGNKFAGVCVNVSCSFAEVKTAGYVELAYTGDAPSVGYAALVAAAADKVKADSSGREYLVIKVDTTAQTVGFMM